MTSREKRGASASRFMFQAAERLRAGEVVAFPTETVYGLGADARNEAAVKRVFEIKRRPADHPLIVHLAEAAQADAWAVEVPDTARRLMARFWPGPLTLVLPAREDVPRLVTGGQDSVALRVPSHPLALALLNAFGGGLAAPSANRFGALSPTEAWHVRASLGDQVDLVLDGGPCRYGLESTIVSLLEERPRVLRPGALPLAALREALGEVGIEFGAAACAGCLARPLRAHHTAGDPRSGKTDPARRGVVGGRTAGGGVARQPQFARQAAAASAAAVPPAVATGVLRSWSLRPPARTGPFRFRPFAGGSAAGRRGLVGGQ